jgi:hypothetical protein
MALTRTQVEKVMIRRAGKSLAFVSLDGTTNDGTNEDLADPIASTLQAMGYTVADITNPTDAELAGVTAVNQFLDRCELRVLETVLGNMDMVSFSTGPRSENLSDFTGKLEKTIAEKRDFIQREYGVSLGSLSTGKINLNFQTKGDDDPYYA